MAKTHLAVSNCVFVAKRGVGFRPFVWQLAQQLNLHGDVCNDGDGVEVRLLEDPETFLVQLHQHCPPLARISVEREPFIWSQLPTGSPSARARVAS